MESFFSPLQKNVLDHPRWTPHAEPRLTIITWIERGPTTAVGTGPDSED